VAREENYGDNPVHEKRRIGASIRLYLHKKIFAITENSPESSSKT
jgi:hypothetical protein